MARVKEIQLLRSVLSPLSDVCNRQSNDEKYNVNASLLGTKLSTISLSFYSLFGNAVKESDSTTLLAGMSSLVTDMLRALEDLLDESSNQMHNFTAVQYPKLYSISRKGTNFIPSSLIPFDSDLETHKQNLSLVNTAVDALIKHLQSIVVKAPPETESSGIEGGVEEFSLLDPFALRGHALASFNAIKSFCEECKSSGCSYEHFGLLFMRAYDKRFGPVFDFLLSLQEAGEPPWGECHITPPASQQGASILSPLLAGSTRCSRLNRRCLHANFQADWTRAEDDAASLREVRTANPQRTNLRDAAAVTLRDILQDSDAPSWPVEARIMLAFSITFSTLALTNTPWIPGCLSIDAIRFLQDETFLFLEPCILSKFQLHTEFDNLKEGLNHHDDPFRLALGIVLIELWTQSTLESAHTESDLQDGGSLSENTQYDVAKRVAIEADFSIHQHYQTAIHNCIQPRHWAQTTTYENQEYQMFLKEKIFRPLYSELRALPDFNLSKLENLLQHVNMPNVEAVSRRVKLFDKFVAQSSDSNFKYLMSEMRKLCEMVFDIRSTNARRVKVAIIDTGIDYRHTLFHEKSEINNVKMINRMKFTNCIIDDATIDVTKRELCMDRDGHGTHIAGIFRYIEKLVDIHILKVSDGIFFGDVNSTANSVKRAIDIAKDWEADIINMSFGFPDYLPALKPIEASLKEAISKGIIIFASSHNEGSSRSIPWPAIDKDLVIRISSADAYGQKSEFSPLPRLKEDNISTLGENITSTYTTPSEVRQHTTMKTLSGASFATPIAVCMAAIVLYLTENTTTLTSVQCEGIKTIRGMRQILIDNFVEEANKLIDGFSYISPKFFFQNTETLEDMVTLIKATLVKVRKGNRA